MGLGVFACPRIFTADVMHRRHRPVGNQFTYKTYALAARLDDYESFPGVAYERFGPLSFYRKDHGERTGGDLWAWANGILNRHGFSCPRSHIVLVTMPRVMGYVFNPVSFWLCYNSDDALFAVLCEVNNTFGETHTYLCVHHDAREIKPADILRADKVFHVSPLLHRTGEYRFRFNITPDTMGVWIDYDDAPGCRMLSTAMTGALHSPDRLPPSRLFWTYPLMTLKIIGLIHWQALRLLVRGIPYVRKPSPIMTNVSSTRDVE